MSDVLNCFYLATRHKDFNFSLLTDVERQDFNLVKNVATPKARKLYEMHTNVSRAICKIKSFLRFDISKHGILYTTIKSDHDIIDLLLLFFHDRFPTFYIAIEDKKNTYVIFPNGDVLVYECNLVETIKKMETFLPILEITNDFSFNDDLWMKYYDSQFINERKNPKLMQSMMPLKYRQQNSIETLISKRCKNLNDFL